MGTEAVTTPSVPPIVLIVEDDLDTRDLYETVFNLAGFWVAEAPDAEAAFQHALELQPDVIVTDIGLAGRCDGVDLASRLHAVPRMADVPVIAVTGRNLAEIGTEAEFSELLQKPVTPDMLVETTRRVLAASAALRARGERARARIPELIEKSDRLLNASASLRRAPDDSDA
jgi:CheY-like chemotaxis protein